MIPTIYTGKIRGVDVRFFPPQTTDEDLMPWVDVEALMSAMHLSRGQRQLAETVIKQHYKRINTPAGMTSVLSHGWAQSLIEASANKGYVAASFMKRYFDHSLEAAQLFHPEMWYQSKDGRWGIDPVSLARLMGVSDEELIDLVEDNLDKIEEKFGHFWLLPGPTRH
jgi:hypothetical protein